MADHSDTSNYTPSSNIEGGERALRNQFVFLPKDFVATHTGHVFALLSWGLENDRVLGTLRYLHDGQRLHKLSSQRAASELEKFHDSWLIHCPKRDVLLPAVPKSDIQKCYHPTRVLADRLGRAAEVGSSNDAWRIIGQLLAEVDGISAGVTGSYLIDAAGLESDIDLIVYGNADFERFRDAVGSAVAGGAVNALSIPQWRAAYERRGCQLTLAEYIWHEQRKRNKFSVAGVKVDVSCIDAPPKDWENQCVKEGKRTILAKVIDATRAFAQPAEYIVEHAEIEKVVSYTPTYTGQAFEGETIEACGWVEVRALKSRVLVIGSSREADGEWIRVLR